MLDDAKREFTSLLEEVRRQTGADLVVRVAEQMLHAFPDSREALGALVWAKLASGAHAEAIKLLKPAVAKYPDDIPLRESLVSAYEAAGDDTAAQRVWREIAELYKRRGDLEKSRDILQRYVTARGARRLRRRDHRAEPAPHRLDRAARRTDLIELDEPESRGRRAGEPAAPPKPRRPRRAPRSSSRRAARRSRPTARRISQPSARDAAGCSARRRRRRSCSTEARVSLEFGDREEALRIATSVLEQEPDNAAARELFVQAGGTPARAEPTPSELDDDELSGPDRGALVRRVAASSPPEPVAAAGDRARQLRAPELAALSAGEDFDTLPDIEIVLEDEEDRDEHFASVEPPIELALERTPFGQKPAAAKPPAAKPPVAKPQPPKPVAATAPRRSRRPPTRRHRSRHRHRHRHRGRSARRRGPRRARVLQADRGRARVREAPRQRGRRQLGRRLGAGRGEPLRGGLLPRAGSDRRGGADLPVACSSSRRSTRRRCCASGEIEARARQGRPRSRRTSPAARSATRWSASRARDAIPDARARRSSAELAKRGASSSSVDRRGHDPAARGLEPRAARRDRDRRGQPPRPLELEPEVARRRRDELDETSESERRGGRVRPGRACSTRTTHRPARRSAR